MDRGGDLLWTWHGVGRRNRQNIPQGMKGICCNQSDRGASQPATDASPPVGTPQAPSDASLVEHTNDRGAIQPAASRTMRSRAETSFDNMVANKINFAIIIIVIIIIIFVLASVSLSLSLSTGAKTFDTNQQK